MKVRVLRGFKRNGGADAGYSTGPLVGGPYGPYRQVSAQEYGNKCYKTGGLGLMVGCSPNGRPSTANMPTTWSKSGTHTDVSALQNGSTPSRGIAVRLVYLLVTTDSAQTSPPKNQKIEPQRAKRMSCA